MVEGDIKACGEKVKDALSAIDSLCTISASNHEPLEVTQALLAASWSLRAATFALSLAASAKAAQPTLGPSPSSKAATGGTG